MNGYSEITEAMAFKEHVSRKRAFVVPTVTFVLLFIIMLPILSSFV